MRKKPNRHETAATRPAESSLQRSIAEKQARKEPEKCDGKVYLCFDALDSTAVRGPRHESESADMCFTGLCC